MLVDAGVLIQGDGLALMYRSCLALAQRRRRDGLSLHPLLREATLTFYRATVMSRQRHPLDTVTTAAGRCNHHDGDLLDSAAAAEILDVSRRTVQRLTRSGQLLAIRVGSIRLYNKVAVMDLARQREAAS